MSGARCTDAVGIAEKTAALLIILPIDRDMDLMNEIISRIGFLSAGEYWVLDVLADVQVGWVNRDKDDRQWYVLDTSFERKAGPFRTLAEARSCAEDTLREEFGIGSPAN
jgi:hypothetical protein